MRVSYKKKTGLAIVYFATVQLCVLYLKWYVLYLNCIILMRFYIYGLSHAILCFPSHTAMTRSLIFWILKIIGVFDGQLLLPQNHSSQIFLEHKYHFRESSLLKKMCLMSANVDANTSGPEIRYGAGIQQFRNRTVQTKHLECVTQ